MTSRAGRKCQTCSHGEGAAIDAALVRGDSLTAISDQFGISPQSLIRHRDAHLPRAAVAEAAQAVAEAEGQRGTGLLADAASLRAKAGELLAEAQKAGDLRTALMGVREAARCIELMGKLAGDIDPSSTINVFVSPSWVALQTAILASLAPHPAARADVIRALESVR